LVASKPYSTIFFLVGKTARVRPDQIDVPSGNLVTLPDEDEFCNLFEGDAGWITINPFNGRIRTSDLANVEPTLPVSFATAIQSSRETALNAQ